MPEGRFLPGTAFTEQAKLIGHALQVELRDCEPATGGQNRTFLATVEGRRMVVKWDSDRDLSWKVPYVASQIPELRRRGCQVPAVLGFGDLPRGGFAWLQECVPGQPADVLTDGLLAQLIELVGSFANAPAGPHKTDITKWVPAVVVDDKPGWWKAAESIDQPTERFVRVLRRWYSEIPAPEARRDFVHGDLNLGNVMIQDGLMTGVIDLEHLGVGDRTVDIARLAFEWQRQLLAGANGLAGKGLERLMEAGHAIGGEPGWRIAIAYEIISRIGWHCDNRKGIDPRPLVMECRSLFESVSEGHTG